MVANSTIGDATLSSYDNPNWATVPTSLSGSVDSNLGFLGDTLDTHGSAVAHWASADSGDVIFTNYGWDFAVNNAQTSSSNLTENRGGDDWTYTFTATQNGVITMSYDVAGFNNTFGLWGWSVDFNGSGSGGPVINPFDPANVGVFTGSLVAGQTYTIGLSGNPNIEFNGPPGAYSGGMDGYFTWEISGSVPEPATWALMLMGLGLVGGLSRRRIAAA
jgi:hypothetical protein